MAIIFMREIKLNDGLFKIEDKIKHPVFFPSYTVFDKNTYSLRLGLLSNFREFQPQNIFNIFLIFPG